MANAKLSNKECSIGRSGGDLLDSQKELTIVMCAREKHSVFTKAVDALYQTVDMPFNLIVVEGNAPEEIRLALEKRQNKNGNMEIIYSGALVSLLACYNLAVSHIKTPFALFIDNETQLSGDVLRQLLDEAKKHPASAVCPKGSLSPRTVRKYYSEEGFVDETIPCFGYRPCFLIPWDSRYGSHPFFNEKDSAATSGLMLSVTLRRLGFATMEHAHARVGARAETGLKKEDLPLYRRQWGRDYYLDSLRYLKEKWDLELLDDAAHAFWIEEKIGVLEAGSRGFAAKWKNLLSKSKNLAQPNAAKRNAGYEVVKSETVLKG